MPAPPLGSEPAMLSATGGVGLTFSECHSTHVHNSELRTPKQIHFTMQSSFRYTSIMASVQPIDSAPHEPIEMHARAMDHLRYIRETMAKASQFTAVPGWGGVAMGVTALIAGFFAGRQPTIDGWLAGWLAEGMLARGIGARAMKHKADAARETLLTDQEPKCALRLIHSLLDCAVLPVVLY